jgi:hypothetical protein
VLLSARKGVLLNIREDPQISRLPIFCRTPRKDARVAQKMDLKKELSGIGYFIGFPSWSDIAKFFIVMYQNAHIIIEA